MDGPLIATVVSSSVVIVGAISGGFWRILVRLGDQNKGIGRLEGKVDGLDIRMHSYEQQLDGFDKRVNRLDNRINGFLDYVTNAKTKRKKKES